MSHQPTSLTAACLLAVHRSLSLARRVAAGVRKEVRVQGKSVLIFWYRNEIYAIEARCAPAFTSA